jgi:uncharacterized protein involved in type VI secretion and phage assembly
MNGDSNRFYGKYRGVVTNTDDPESRARIRATVPAVFGEEESGWALPCAPYVGEGVGAIAIPPVNALVWIEFEHGDPEYPIWTGGFWGSGREAPGEGAIADIKLLKSQQHLLKLDDAASTLTLAAPNGMTIVLGPEGIEINNGQGASIKLQGNQVSINDGALEVT